MPSLMALGFAGGMALESLVTESPDEMGVLIGCMIAACRLCRYQPGGQVDAADFERDDLAGANRGLSHEADDGLVAEVVEVLVKLLVVGPGARPG